MKLQTFERKKISNHSKVLVLLVVVLFLVSRIESHRVKNKNKNKGIYQTSIFDSINNNYINKLNEYYYTVPPINQLNTSNLNTYIEKENLNINNLTIDKSNIKPLTPNEVPNNYIFPGLKAEDQSEIQNSNQSVEVSLKPVENENNLNLSSDHIEASDLNEIEESQSNEKKKDKSKVNISEKILNQEIDSILEGVNKQIQEHVDNLQKLIKSPLILQKQKVHLKKIIKKYKKLLSKFSLDDKNKLPSYLTDIILALKKEFEDSYSN